VTVLKEITNRNGKVIFWILTYRTTTKGMYKVLEETTYSGYLASFSSTSFPIR